jgi:hypothetical protein
VVIARHFTISATTLEKARGGGRTLTNSLHEGGIDAQKKSDEKILKSIVEKE